MVCQMSKSRCAAIFLNLVVFIVFVVLSYQAKKTSKLYPMSAVKVSKDHNTEITPTNSTMIIWIFVHLYQLFWIIYSLSLCCRKAPNILSNWFYFAYSLANICCLGALIVWTRAYIGLSFALMAVTSILLKTSLYLSYRALYNYTSSFPRQAETPSVPDVWCIRMLVQNGVIFYNAWLLVATCWGFTVFLQYDLDANGARAATGSLCVIFILMLVWFVLENFVLEKFTRFTFVEYIVIIVAMSGILKKNWTNGHGNEGFALFILILSAVFLLFRIIFIIVKEKRGYYNEEESLTLIVRN
eukprot:gene6116-6820_t